MTDSQNKPQPADEAPESIPAAEVAPDTAVTTPLDSAADSDAGAAEPGAAEPGSAQPSAPAGDAGQNSRNRRGWLIGGGIAAAVILIAGGVGIGAAIASIGDDDHDRDDRSSSVDQDDRPGPAEGDRPARGDRGEEGGGRGDRGDGGGREDNRSGDASESSLVTGVASADALNEIITAAEGVADGDAVSVDQERDGSWEVQLWSDQGESDVNVVDGVATVTATEAADANDQAPLGTLDAATVDALVKAALAEADGTITEISVGENTVSPYDVTVRTAAGAFVDIELDQSFAVVTAKNEGTES